MEHINKLRAELKELIESKADYDLILKKSQELDEYIFEEDEEFESDNRDTII